ncbi:hypothetical protein GCM10022408_18340 [Hymenobacter fastidiosus]|uniref:Lipoprotein n=1 Tax=Hymenobacter fastidiosus TaxID=486264 RepID=A0ABP7S5G1_9BACT
MTRLHYRLNKLTLRQLSFPPRVLGGLSFFLVGCGMSACTLLIKKAELYRLFLNTGVPATATHFVGKGIDHPLADFMSWGYFTYGLDRAAWETLLQHKQFIRQSEWNRAFTRTPFPVLDAWHLKYYSELVRHPITITEKNNVAYTATFFPYIHTLVYDSSAHQVQHFVAGMRD